VVVDLLLTGKIALQGLTGEQSIEAFAIINVCLSIQEDPVLGPEKFVRSIDNARFNKRGRVKDLPCYIASRSNDDKSGYSALVWVMVV
jgi:hypothetical protein